MAAVDMTADVPMSPQDMWDHVADLSDDMTADVPMSPDMWTRRTCRIWASGW